MLLYHTAYLVVCTLAVVHNPLWHSLLLLDIGSGSARALAAPPIGRVRRERANDRLWARGEGGSYTLATGRTQWCTTTRCRT